MAVVRTVGDPDEVAGDAVAALFSAVYELRDNLRRQTGRSFAIRPLRARWPNAQQAPRSEWSGEWALPIPDDVLGIPQADAVHQVAVVDWDYGPIVEIRHVGAFDTEFISVEVLKAYVDKHGYRIVGPHEEEYLSMPGEDDQETLIRYRIAPKL
jgi:hypothetical protein